MVTKEEALTGQRFEHMTAQNADKTPLRARANGACKVWKTRPDEFKLAVRIGWKGHGYITNENAHEWRKA